MTKTASLWRSNRRAAREVWGALPRARLIELKHLTETFRFSISLGEVQLLDRKWYVTHTGLLALAMRRRCASIRVQQVHRFCDPLTNRWVFKATVHKSPGSASFAGYGDANPTNVSRLVRGAEMRVAETRAVNRALRKAYGIGLCSVD